MSKGKEVTIRINKIRTGRASFCIIGRTPLIFNSMSAKTKRTLLLPTKKTAADKAITLKHDPDQEYRDSVYRSRDPKSPTLLVFVGSAFKKTMMSAALRIPGATKTEIGQLTWVEEFNTAIYGIPQLSMMPVRSADINKTPDIRTRAALHEWACRVTISYVEPNLSGETIANLLGSGGLLAGVGDGRQEKGSLSFGQFELTEESDKRFQAILKNGRAVQERAMANPTFFDEDSEELYTWFHEQLNQSGAHNKLRAVKVA